MKTVGLKSVTFLSKAAMTSSIRFSLGSSGIITAGNIILGFLFRVITGNSPVNCTGNLRILALNRVAGPLDLLEIKENSNMVIDFKA